MNNMKQTILGLFAALILMTASCSNDEKDEPTTYDPATEIAGTYLGETKVTNGTSSYSYPESTFIIRKESTGGVRYDLIQNNGKELLTNIYTTVGYSQDKSEYVLAAINENGTITKSGNISYTGTCSVNGEKGYTFSFIGYKEK